MLSTLVNKTIFSWYSDSSLLSFLTDKVWGFDFFISYAHADGRAYANSLRDQLVKRGYSVFLDTQDGFRAGDSLRTMTRRRVRHSTYLIILGRPFALSRSPWVRLEAEHYLDAQVGRNTGRRPLVIDINSSIGKTDRRSAAIGSLIQHPEFDDWRHIVDESVDAMESPALETIKSLLSSFTAARRDTIRARLFGAIASLLLVLAIGAAIFGIKAMLAQSLAEQRLASSYLSLADANHREGRGNRASALASQAVVTADSLENRKFVTSWPPATLIETFSKPDLDVTTLALSQSGKLAIGDTKGYVHLLRLTADMSAEKATRALKVGGTDIYELVFSPDGDRLAVSVTDGSIWQVELTGKSVHSQIEPPHSKGDNTDIELNDIAYLSDGSLAFLTDDEDNDRVLFLLDVDGKKSEPIKINSNGYDVSEMAAHPNKRKLAFIFSNGGVEIIDFDAGMENRKRRILDSFPLGETLSGNLSAHDIVFNPTPVRELEESDEQDQLVAALDQATLWFLTGDGALGRQLKFPRPTEGTIFDRVKQLAFSPDGRRLFALRSNGALGIFERQKEWKLERIIDGYLESDQDIVMACCAGESLLATAAAAADGSADVVKVWDISSAHRRWRTVVERGLTLKDARVTHVSFDDTGTLLAAGTDKGQVMVFDVVRRRLLGFSHGHYADGQIHWTGFRPNQGFPMLGRTTNSAEFRMWFLGACQEEAIDVSTDPGDILYGAGWSADGTRLALAPYNLNSGGQYVLRDLSAMPVPEQRSAHFDDNIPERLVPVLEGKAWVAYLGLIDHFHYWNGKEGTSPVKVSVGRGETVQSLTAVADGSIILASLNNRIARWRLDNDAIVPMPDIPCGVDPGDGCSGSPLVIDPKKRWFAAVSSNNILIRRISDGTLLAKLSGHAGQIDTLAASPTGLVLASGSWDHNLIVWDLQDLFLPGEQVVLDTQTAAGFTVDGADLVEVAKADPQFRRLALLRLKPQVDRDGKPFKFSFDIYAQDNRASPTCAVFTPGNFLSRDRPYYVTR